MTAAGTSTHGALTTTRGTVLESTPKEHAQLGLIHAIAAAAGRTVSSPFPDYNGIDCTIKLSSECHSAVKPQLTWHWHRSRCSVTGSRFTDRNPLQPPVPVLCATILNCDCA